LSHLVAISGFNFAVLGIGTAILMRVFGGPWRLTAVVTAGLAAAYLVAVDDEPSVARAGFVAVAGAAAEACGRRYRATSLLGAIAILLLAIDPLAIADPGFQLTFAAVLALRWAASPLGERWYGRDEEAPATAFDACVGAIRSLVVSSIAVWLVVTPLSVVHFGQVSWLGLPLSIVAIPLGGLTIASGLAVASVACIHESLAVPLAHAWVHLTGALLWIAELPSRWQVPDLEVGRVGWAWAAIVSVAAVAWCRSRLWPVRRAAFGLLAVGWTGVAGAAIRHGHEATLEWVMLDVGDGSCHILRHGDVAVVFDAGSLDLSSLGIRTVAPALRASGVRRLEAVIVSHPNLDHFAAVPAILARFPTERLIVNPVMYEAATRDPDGASGQLLAAAAAFGVPIEIGAAGRREWLAGSSWTWLHPHPDARYAGDNDGSQVIHVQYPVGDRTFDAVLAGDLETAGVRDLIGRNAVPRPHLVELPHHGSWRPAVAAWIESMRPAAVYQSTGPERWQRDRWRDVLSGSTRRVTCVDGAVRARIEVRGEGGTEPVVRLSRWASSRWEPCGIIPIDRDVARELSAAEAVPAATGSRPRSGRVRPRSPRSRDPVRRSESESRSIRSRRGSSDDTPRVDLHAPPGRRTSTRCPGHAASPRRRGSTTPSEASTAPTPDHAGSRRRHPPDRVCARSRTREANTTAMCRWPSPARPGSRKAAIPRPCRERTPEGPRDERGWVRDPSPRNATRVEGLE
jgi:ComEC/Rec2-related protein